jgi:hypothetical protein
MIKNLINNPKHHSIVVKVISTMVFLLLFVCITVVFEFVYRGSVTNQINSLVHNIVFFGVK